MSFSNSSNNRVRGFRRQKLNKCNVYLAQRLEIGLSSGASGAVRDEIPDAQDREAANGVDEVVVGGEHNHGHGRDRVQRDQKARRRMLQPWSQRACAPQCQQQCTLGIAAY